MNNTGTLHIALYIAGRRACFRRPEFTNDLVSYDVLPPFVAQQMLKAIYMPDRALWKVSRIRVLKPIRFIMDQVVNARGPRRVFLLEDVAYVVHAELRGERVDPVLHGRLFAEAVREKSDVHLGMATLPATIRLADDEDLRTRLFDTETRDLGWMIRELRSPQTKLPSFFRAQIVNGYLDIDDDAFTVG